MAHELDFSNNRVNMAYVGKEAWHGLGNKLQPGASVAEWAAAAGFQFEANRGPMFTKIDGEFVEIPEQIVLTRSDTKAFLGAFSSQYVAAQPTDILSFFQEFILTDERFQLETAGCLKGGKVIWALAKFQEDITVLGDRHVAYTFLTTSFDGSLATTAQATMIRVVCKNTLMGSLFAPGAATVRVRHNKEFKGVVAEEAHAQLAQVASTFPRYERMALALNNIKITREQTQKLFESLIAKPKPATGDKEKEVSKRRYTQALADLNHLLHKTWDEGLAKGSAWSAFNAVTDYVDHHKGTRRTTQGETADMARMHSACFGSGSSMKAKALKNLISIDPNAADNELFDLAMAA